MLFKRFLAFLICCFFTTVLLLPCGKEVEKGKRRPCTLFPFKTQPGFAVDRGLERFADNGPLNGDERCFPGIQREGPRPYSTIPTDWGADDDSIAGFLRFVGGDAERTRKMQDPFYRHRITQVASRWQRLFYKKTPYFYEKGIDLFRFSEGRYRISLVKSKTNYEALMGGLWSNEAFDRFLELHDGWMSNQAIFGEGRAYYFEFSVFFP